MHDSPRDTPEKTHPTLPIRNRASVAGRAIGAAGPDPAVSQNIVRGPVLPHLKKFRPGTAGTRPDRCAVKVRHSGSIATATDHATSPRPARTVAAAPYAYGPPQALPTPCHGRRNALSLRRPKAVTYPPNRPPGALWPVALPTIPVSPHRSWAGKDALVMLCALPNRHCARQCSRKDSPSGQPMPVRTTP